jgi:hypothetical protein
VPPQHGKAPKEHPPSPQEEEPPLQEKEKAEGLGHYSCPREKPWSRSFLG